MRWHCLGDPKIGRDENDDDVDDYNDDDDDNDDDNFSPNMNIGDDDDNDIHTVGTMVS